MVTTKKERKVYLHGCSAKMMNGIAALHLLPIRKGDTEKNGSLFRGQHKQTVEMMWT